MDRGGLFAFDLPVNALVGTRTRCATCDVDRFAPDTSGTPCDVCVNDKHVYVCKACGVVYMHPQYSPVCGPHFCMPEHMAMPVVRARLVWHPADMDEEQPTHVHDLVLPVWACSPNDVARALLRTVPIVQFLALDQPYANGKWAHKMEQKFRVPPRLVAAESTLVSDYIARAQNDATTLDVMRYLCDELRVCMRSHPVHAIMDHVPLAHDGLTVGHLLGEGGGAMLADYMDPGEFYAFTYANGVATRLDADKHVWNAGLLTTIINVATTHAITLVDREVAPPPPQAQVVYPQKQPMSVKRDHNVVEAWCRTHGAPRSKSSGSHLPVRRHYESVRCVNGTSNFIAQLRGFETYVQRVLDAQFPDTPSITYAAAHAERSLMLIECASPEERDARIAQLAEAVARPPDVKQRRRVINDATMQLLREWVGGEGAAAPSGGGARKRARE